MMPFSLAVREFAKRCLFVLALLSVIAGVVLGLGTELLAEVRFRRAQEALGRFDFASAREYLQGCLALRPNRFQYHFAAAQTERRAGFFRQALYHLDRCQELAGPDADIGALERSLLKAQQGALAQVESPLWRLVEEDHPEKKLILEALARGYLAVYSLPLADKALKLLVEEEPTHAEAWFLRGGVCELLGAPSEGLDYYRRALELRPDNDMYRLRLANDLLICQREEEALPYLEQLCVRQPNNPDALSALARALSLTNRKARARDLLVRALALAPHNSQALAENARLDFDAGQFAKAEGGLEKALKADPTDRANQYLLYQCLERSGKKEAALKQLARWKALGKELTRLETIVRSELPKNPHSADLYCELGSIFARHNQPDRARFSFQQALTFDPNHRPSLQALKELVPVPRAQQP